MKFSELADDSWPQEWLPKHSLNSSLKDFEVLDLTHDSRNVKKGTLFVALRGLSIDSHQFVEEALSKGALVLGEEERMHELYLKVDDSRKALGLLAASFYQHPSREMLVVGVTGTSGKTTTAYLLEAIFQADGKRCGVIGTINWRFAGKEVPATHTTPHPVALQKTLADFKTAGCDVLVMEVSSHALKQSRVAGVLFDGMIFTNLSEEHLDYHPDMEDYFSAKAMLFTELADRAKQQGKKPIFAINQDSSYGQRLIQMAAPHGDCLKGFRLSEQTWNFSSDGIAAKIEGMEIQSSLMGQFNASNILGAALLAKGLKVSPAQIKAGLAQLKAVPGRLEKVQAKGWKGATVLVDYAHKPDALEKVLMVLRPLCQGRLITVVGCGGDRDQKKRPVMAKIAHDFSDFVILTSDNPRTEDPQTIVDMMLKGLDPAEMGKSYRVELDRKKAIELAVIGTTSEDLVLVAGKGHESYQILPDPKSPGRTHKVDFSDQLMVLAAMGS